MRKSDRIVLKTETAPAPVGPYSQAIRHGDLLFVAGQIALDPKTGQLVGTTAGEQTEQALRNIEAIIQFAGLTLWHVTRCVVYVVDLREMAAVNEVFTRHFVYEPPVRTTVQVAALPGGARVEIEATAVLTARETTATDRGTH
jgi:2-iminobutanoate/2-iminopropanoate deaminase